MPHKKKETGSSHGVADTWERGQCVAQVSLGVSVVIWSPAPPFLTRMRTTSPINLPKYSADHRHKIRGVLILPECDVSRVQMRSAERR